MQVPRGKGREVLEIAEKHKGVNLATFQADGVDESFDVVIAHTNNARVEDFIKELQGISPLYVSFAPQGFLTLKPPPEETPQQVTDVTALSPIEIYLSGLQSVGSWKGLIGYAIAAGAVVWIGLFTDAIFLLTASMLIAPFAGPAMNAAIATARGDSYLLGRSLLRYFGGILITIAVAAFLSFILRQEVATATMISSSELSATAVLLPLIAGFAGAFNLAQSQRNSLVSGAATGILVAASIAPPAGLIGMAAVIGKWEMVVSGLFVLLLQIIGINLSGSIVFRKFGLTPHNARYERGKAWVFYAALGATALMIVGLLIWQFWNSPSLQRSTREQRAAAVVQDAVDNSGIARLVETNVRFTRANITGQSSLLIELYAQVQTGEPLSFEENRRISRQLTDLIKSRIKEENFDVTPLVSVNVLEAGKPAKNN